MYHLLYTLKSVPQNNVRKAASAGDHPVERYNAAPTNQLAFFTGKESICELTWCAGVGGLTRAKTAQPPINARVEKVAHGPFFLAIWSHRAIIGINNWFEWVDESGPKKQPYLIRRKDRPPILCVAIGQSPNAEHPPGEHDGVVIITADSAGGMVGIRDRRPVTLSPEVAREWLHPGTPKERAEQVVLFQGEPTEFFEWFNIDGAIGNVRNHGADLIRPVQ
ncbi:SOS response-associated peptidase family protein [Pseudomonas frederiksbergensis]|uniref:SOS response-associated peptidase family protein n=1 Tax=Pseudomonas frederiksbergensis TaxID=104087 RepID=UPI0016141BF4|nr:SOS response-associated peptidase family protein [Pseudomonas frederiksbergensis]